MPTVWATSSLTTWPSPQSTEALTQDGNRHNAALPAFWGGRTHRPGGKGLSGSAAYAFGENIEIILGSSEGGAARIDGPAHIRIIWLAREQV